MRNAHRRRRHDGGFTLVEMLVAIGVFSIAMGIIVDLFLVASRQQTQTAASSRLQSDARLVVETIAKELRDGEIVDDPAAGADLSIRNAGGAVHFRRASTACPSGAQSCVEVGRGTGGSVAYASLTSSDIEAEAFDLVSSDAAQPFVTLHLVLSTPGGKVGERERVEAQTTIVSRHYGR